MYVDHTHALSIVSKISSCLLMVPKSHARMPFPQNMYWSEVEGRYRRVSWRGNSGAIDSVGLCSGSAVDTNPAYF